MNAVSKMVTLFDPFGNDFPKPVRDTVKTFFDRDPSDPSYRWRHSRLARLARD